MSAPATWALVMNGTRARVLRGLEDGNGKDPIELLSRAPSTHLRDVMADKPGRSFASEGGGRRSAMELGSDPIRRDMQDFAGEVADLLETHRRAGDFHRLAIFADPHMLGILRAEFPATLWETVFLDMPMNIVSLSQDALRDRVLEHIHTKS